MGSSGEDPCQVTEVQPPAQQAAPVRVAVVVVVDDAGEAQRHVAKKRRVLHHMGISCRDVSREESDKEEEGYFDDNVCADNTQINRTKDNVRK